MKESVYLKEAKYLGEFRVFLVFNDGRSGEVDLKETVHKHAAASPLRKPQAFSLFHLDSWPTLAWDCGFDVAPETLYEKCDRDRLTEADKGGRQGTGLNGAKLSLSTLFVASFVESQPVRP